MVVACITGTGRRDGEESIDHRETPLPSEPEHVDCTLVIRRTLDKTDNTDNTHQDRLRSEDILH